MAFRLEAEGLFPILTSHRKSIQYESQIRYLVVDKKIVRTWISKKQSLPSELQDRLPFAITLMNQNVIEVNDIEAYRM